MPTYTYETIPSTPDESVERFEVKQSILEPALTRHPKTGIPVRRVITGGIGYAKSASGGGGHSGGG